MRYLVLVFIFSTFYLNQSFSQQADSVVVKHCFYKGYSSSHPVEVKNFMGYDSLGVLLFEFNLDADNHIDTLETSDSTRYNYDTQGRLISVYDYIFTNFPVHTPEKRVFYTYDSLNQVTNFLEEAWSVPTSSWTLTQDIYYEYSISGTVDSSRTFTPTGGQAIGIYIDSTLNISTTTYWRLDSIGWVPNYRSTSWKDNAGNDTLYIGERGTGATWINHQRIERFYNAAGNLFLARTSNWDSTAWKYNDDETRIYDINNRVDTVVNRYWIGNVWVNFMRAMHDYDSSNQMVLSQTDYWVVDSSSYWEPNSLRRWDYSSSQEWEVFYSFFWEKTTANWDTFYVTIDSLDNLSRIFYRNTIYYDQGTRTITRNYFDIFGNEVYTVSDGVGYSHIGRATYNSQNQITYYYSSTSSRQDNYSEECFYYRSPHSNSGFVLSLPDSTGICLGEVKNLNASVLLSNTPLSFSWSPSAGLSSDTILSPDFSPVTSTLYTLTVTDSLGRNTDYSLTFNVFTPPPLVQIDSVILTGHCFPDTILLFTASQAQYQYEWINTLTGQKINNDTLFYSKNGASNSYYLNVIDSAGCLATSDTVDVMMHPRVNCIHYTTPSNFCFGDTVRLNASPQLASYVYQWKKDSTALTGAIQTTLQINQSGMYTLETVDTLTQCSSVFNLQRDFLQVNPPASLLIFPDTFICNSEITWLFSEYNSPNWSYRWFKDNNYLSSQANDSLLVTGGGNYSLQVTNASCPSYSDTISIVSRNFYASISVSSTDTICAYDSVTVTTGLAQQYLWSTGETTRAITVNQTGSYSVIATDSLGCSSNPSFVNVNVHTPIPTPIISFVSPYLISSEGGIYLQWYLNGVPIPGGQVISHQPLVDGNYKVLVTDSNYCEFFSLDYYYSELGTASTTRNNQLKLYPNPLTSNSRLEYSGSGKIIEVEIFDSKLNAIISYREPGNNLMIDGSTLGVGFYFFKVLFTEHGNIHQSWLKFSVVD